MTTSMIAKTLHARRYATGRYMARCPVHGRDRNPSLSICDMGGGNTRIHCFGGCSQKAVLEALGWTWKDLTDAKPMDREAYKAIEKERARQEAEDRRKRAVRNWMATQALHWEREAAKAGAMLAEDLSCDWLAHDFHEALRKMRVLHSAIAPTCHPANRPTETICSRMRK